MENKSDLSNLPLLKLLNMRAYVIVDVDITDPVKYEDYKKLTPGSLVPLEGKFIVRAGRNETLEGSWQPGRIVVTSFNGAKLNGNKLSIELPAKSVVTIELK